jgi:hypothetical protein
MSCDLIVQIWRDFRSSELELASLVIPDNEKGFRLSAADIRPLAKGRGS